MAEHSNKEIREAINYAKKNGWTIEKSSGHPWGIMICPKNQKDCWGGKNCKKSIWSTPSNPQNHAKQLRGIVDKCQFLNKDKEDSENDDE